MKAPYATALTFAAAAAVVCGACATTKVARAPCDSLFPPELLDNCAWSENLRRVGEPALWPPPAESPEAFRLGFLADPRLRPVVVRVERSGYGWDVIATFAHPHSVRTHSVLESEFEAPLAALTEVFAGESIVTVMDEPTAYHGCIFLLERAGAGRYQVVELRGPANDPRAPRVVRAASQVLQVAGHPDPELTASLGYCIGASPVVAEPFAR